VLGIKLALTSVLCASIKRQFPSTRLFLSALREPLPRILKHTFGGIRKKRGLPLPPLQPFEEGMLEFPLKVPSILPLLLSPKTKEAFLFLRENPPPT